MPTSCRRLDAALTDEEAYAVLEPFFRETRLMFVEKGLTRCRETKLVVEADAHDTARHFAGCSDDGQEIVVAPQLAQMPVDNVVAILAHEFGHAADFLYPARFLMADGELVHVFEGAKRVSLENMDQRAAYNMRRQWERREASDVELTADAVANYVTGREIKYNGPCMLQTYGPGTGRPRELR